MIDRPWSRIRRLAAVACLAGAGCAGTSVESTRSPAPAAIPNQTGMVEHRTRGAGSLLLAPDHHIGDYDEIWIADLGFGYAPGQQALREGQERQILGLLRDKLGFDIGTDAIGVGDGPGPCTLKLGLFLEDLDFRSSRESGRFGAVTLRMDFRDSETDEPLVRYGRRRSLDGAAPADGTPPDLYRLGLTLDAMFQELGDELTEILPRTTEARRDAGCQGRIGRAAGGARRNQGGRGRGE